MNRLPKASDKFLNYLDHDAFIRQVLRYRVQHGVNANYTMEEILRSKHLTDLIWDFDTSDYYIHRVCPRRLTPSCTSTTSGRTSTTSSASSSSASTGASSSPTQRRRRSASSSSPRCRRGSTSCATSSARSRST